MQDKLIHNFLRACDLLPEGFADSYQCVLLIIVLDQIMKELITTITLSQVCTLHFLLVERPFRLCKSICCRLQEPIVLWYSPPCEDMLLHSLQIICSPLCLLRYMLKMLLIECLELWFQPGQLLFEAKLSCPNDRFIPQSSINPWKFSWSVHMLWNLKGCRLGNSASSKLTTQQE